MNLARGLVGALTMHLRLYWRHSYRLFQVVIRPGLVALLAVAVLHSHAASAGYFRVLIGSALAGMWSALLGTATFTLAREREWYGTFEMLSGTPTPLGAIFGGYIVAEALIALVSVPVSFLVGLALIGGVRVDLDFPLLLSAIITAITMVALALLLAPVMMLLPALTRWVNTIDYPVWILAGFLFPIALMPGWVTPISWLLAPYWATQAMQRAGAGAGAGALAGVWAAGLGVSAVYLLAATAAFGWAARRLRQEGALARG